MCIRDRLHSDVVQLIQVHIQVKLSILPSINMLSYFLFQLSCLHRYLDRVWFLPYFRQIGICFHAYSDRARYSELSFHNTFALFVYMIYCHILVLY